jgi:hypothetical protein
MFLQTDRVTASAPQSRLPHGIHSLTDWLAIGFLLLNTGPLGMRMARATVCCCT